jgi:hypothetical protein
MVFIALHRDDASAAQQHRAGGAGAGTLDNHVGSLW